MTKLWAMIWQNNWYSYQIHRRWNTILSYPKYENITYNFNKSILVLEIFYFNIFILLMFIRPIAKWESQIHRLETPNSKGLMWNFRPNKWVHSMEMQSSGGPGRRRQGRPSVPQVCYKSWTAQIMLRRTRWTMKQCFTYFKLQRQTAQLLT